MRGGRTRIHARGRRRAGSRCSCITCREADTNSARTCRRILVRRASDGPRSAASCSRETPRARRCCSTGLIITCASGIRARRSQHSPRLRRPMRSSRARLPRLLRRSSSGRRRRSDCPRWKANFATPTDSRGRFPVRSRRERTRSGGMRSSSGCSCAMRSRGPHSRRVSRRTAARGARSSRRRGDRCCCAIRMTRSAAARPTKSRGRWTRGSMRQDHRATGFAATRCST